MNPEIETRLKLVANTEAFRQSLESRGLDIFDALLEAGFARTFDELPPPVHSAIIDAETAILHEKLDAILKSNSEAQ